MHTATLTRSGRRSNSTSHSHDTSVPSAKRSLIAISSVRRPASVENSAQDFGEADGFLTSARKSWRSSTWIRSRRPNAAVNVSRPRAISVAAHAQRRAHGDRRRARCTRCTGRAAAVAARMHAVRRGDRQRRALVAQQLDRRRRNARASAARSRSASTRSGRGGRRRRRRSAARRRTAGTVARRPRAAGSRRADAAVGDAIASAPGRRGQADAADRRRSATTVVAGPRARPTAVAPQPGDEMHFAVAIQLVAKDVVQQQHARLDVLAARAARSPRRPRTGRCRRAAAPCQSVPWATAVNRPESRFAPARL